MMLLGFIYIWFLFAYKCVYVIMDVKLKIHNPHM